MFEEQTLSPVDESIWNSGDVQGWRDCLVGLQEAARNVPVTKTGTPNHGQ